MESKTNLELKHRCPDFGPIRKVLKELGAKKAVVKKQKDYFLNLPDITDGVRARLKVRLEGGKQTAIWYTRPDFEKSKGAVAEIKLFEIKDKKLLPYLQEILGVTTTVEKVREVWRKENTVFHLDMVKNVGKIFEVELQKKGKLTEKDRAVFEKYQGALLPYLGEVIKGSNADLTLQAKK